MRCPAPSIPIRSRLLSLAGIVPFPTWRNKAASAVAPAGSSFRSVGLGLAAGRGVRGRTDLEACDDRRRHGLAVRQIVEHHYSLVGHVVGPLADVEVRQAVLQQ